MEETWLKIKGFEEVYEVSSFGRVRSIPRTIAYSDGRVFNLGYKVRNLVKTSQGYLTVGLGAQNKHKSYRVHRLVALAFIKNPDNLPHVNHIDFDKSNNRVNNLEWISRENNNRHAKPRFHTRDRLSHQEVVDIFTSYHKEKRSMTSLAAELRLDLHTVSDIINSKSWTEITHDLKFLIPKDLSEAEGFETEVWRKYKNLEISSLGGVRGLDGSFRHVSENGSGYLCAGGSFVHRMVAILFVTNPFGYRIINHKNGVKHDNRASNLEWSTPSLNVHHALRFGMATRRKGEEQKLAKLKEEQVVEIRRLYATGQFGLRPLARRFGVGQTTIHGIVHRQTWRHV